jgi:hypothetical protein
MVMKEQRIHLWVALVALALGALALHYRIHPPQKGLTYFWATLFCATDLVLVSALFLSKKTAVWALLLNSFIAFAGIIMMTDLTIVSTMTGGIKASPFREPVLWFIQSLLPDVSIAVADFMTGLALYKAMMADPAKSVA